MVIYALDSSAGSGYVYIPGKADQHFQSNVRTIFRGVEGSWFHAWPVWDRVAVPLITKARASGSSANATRWSEDDRKELLAKAGRGDANSQMWLAAAYEQGWFGERNVAEALKWFRKSAAKGNPDAQNSLKQMYEDGEGIKQSYVLAAKWYLKAAEHVPNLGGAGRVCPRRAHVYLREESLAQKSSLATAKSALHTALHIRVLNTLERARTHPNDAD